MPWKGGLGLVSDKPYVFVAFTPAEAEDAGVVPDEGNSCACDGVRLDCCCSWRGDRRAREGVPLDG